MMEYGNEFVCKNKKQPTICKPCTDGKEYIHYCVNCRIDDRGICQGDTIHCENNIKNNSYEVYLMRGAKYVKTIAKGKDEILASSEVEKIVDDWKN